MGSVSVSVQPGRCLSQSAQRGDACLAREKVNNQYPVPGWQVTPIKVKARAMSRAVFYFCALSLKASSFWNPHPHATDAAVAPGIIGDSDQANRATRFADGGDLAEGPIKHSSPGFEISQITACLNCHAAP